MSDPLEERVVDSEVVHRGRYIKFRVDTIERADGSRGTRDVVGHPGAVAVLALDDDGRLLMVRQWRVPAGRALLEIPAGTLDVHDGVTEDPDLCARRELEEETGHRARDWRKLAAFWTAPGFATELMHLYLATGLNGVGGDDDRLAPDEDERLELRHVPLDEAMAMVESGGIEDAKSILGVLWLDRLRRGEAEGADGADGAGSSDTAAGAAPPRTVIRYGFTRTQFALAQARFVRSRPGVRAIGLVFVVIGLLNLLLGPDAWIWGTCLLGGLLFLTGAFAIPFSMLALRTRRHLLANLQFAFDERGVQSVGIASESEIRWAGIDRITRNGPYLFVRFAAGSTILVPVAAFRPEQLDAFGRIALRNGLTLDGHRVEVPAR
jgi:ADP-ribose pyrophosphatase